MGGWLDTPIDLPLVVLIWPLSHDVIDCEDLKVMVSHTTGSYVKPTTASLTFTGKPSFHARTTWNNKRSYTTSFLLEGGLGRGQQLVDSNKNNCPPQNVM